MDRIIKYDIWLLINFLNSLDGNMSDRRLCFLIQNCWTIGQIWVIFLRPSKVLFWTVDPFSWQRVAAPTRTLPFSLSWIV